MTPIRFAIALIFIVVVILGILLVGNKNQPPPS